MKKAISIILTLCLVLLAVGGLAIMSSGFKNWDVTTWFNKAKQAATSSASAITDGSGNPIVNGQALPDSLVFSNSVNTSAASNASIQLTATVSPASAYVEKVDWSAAWTNENSSWAQGKNVEDYLTLTKLDDILAIQIDCVDAFSEQIIITVAVTSYDDNDIKTDTCTVDYVKEILGVSSVKYGGDGIGSWQTLNLSSSGYITLDLLKDDGTYQNYIFDNSSVVWSSLGAGTIEPSKSFTYTLRMQEGFKQWLYQQKGVASFTDNGISDITTEGMKYYLETSKRIYPSYYNSYSGAQFTMSFRWTNRGGNTYSKTVNVRMTVNGLAVSNVSISNSDLQV